LEAGAVPARSGARPQVASPPRIVAFRLGVVVSASWAPAPSARILVGDSTPRTKDSPMAPFPALNHIAVTVRDLTVSVPWYEALFDASPVIDEDTDPNLHHTVFILGNGTLFGLHQHVKPAGDEAFSEYRVGLDHVSFGCTNRGELEEWAMRLD